MPSGTRAPDRLVMQIDGLTRHDANWLAIVAAQFARAHAPKLTGWSASRIMPISGRGWFGLRWQDDRIWFQNSGVNPFLMRSLAGKTIPMWIDDPNGEERAKNPKAQTRVTLSGKTQVLIFRKAAQIGATKMGGTKKVGGRLGQILAGHQVQRLVPQSYPGAPGRITMRGPQKANSWGAAATRNPQIARSNIGIRWYFPGLTPRNFLQNGLVQACNAVGIIPGAIHTGYNFYTTPASVANKIPAYPRQPLGEMTAAMAKAQGKGRGM